MTHARAVAAHVTTDSRELYFVLIRVGTYIQERSALGDVLPLYERGRDVLKRLAEADPGNAGWRHDVAISYSRVGLVAAKGGERDEALAVYQRGLGIMQRLVELAPEHSAFRRDYDWFEARIAELGE